ncbi:MAG TPA: sugar transferase [Usitatibacter sp.]|nr:sugar transferase [Usitatibacter sp.]
MKRAFDIVVTLLAAITWVPAIVFSMLAILVLDGRPVFYVSPRRVHRGKSIRVVKLRTMRRDAERIANRDTVPVQGTRFLNIDRNSPLYTWVGRKIESLTFTELPQLFHVLAGHMSLVGNRPLPENVIESLRAAIPTVEDRFETPAGLTGPIQLAGRERLSDAQRVALESGYCRVAASSYSMWLDFLIVYHTVLVCVGIERPFSFAEIHQLVARFDRAGVLDPGTVEALLEADVEPSPPR